MRSLDLNNVDTCDQRSTLAVLLPLRQNREMCPERKFLGQLVRSMDGVVFAVVAGME